MRSTKEDLKDILGDDFDLDAMLDGVLAEDDPVTPVCNKEPEPEPVAELPEEQVVAAIEAANEAAVEAPVITVPVPEFVPNVAFTNEEIAEAIDLRQFATLVTLNTSQWHARVKDRAAAANAASAVGARKEVFDVTKNLLAGADEKLNRVHKIIGKARTDHYSMTLPWSTVSANDTAGKRRGGRLLPNTRFEDYVGAMAKAKSEVEAALDEFADAYPTLIEIAKKNQGDAFDASEFPNVDSIRNHFDISFDFHPVPIGRDFTGLADAQVGRLADALNKKNNVMLENAMQELWHRLYETVSHAYDRLVEVDSTFHYTMVDRLKGVVSDLEHLNVVGDVRLKQFAERIKKNLTMHGAKEIRKDDALRRHLADEAKKILDDLNEMGNQ